MKNERQTYEPCTVMASHQYNLSFVTLRRGTFMHVNAGKEGIEISMDDEGNVQVCISNGVEVASFDEVYGKY